MLHDDLTDRFRIPPGTSVRLKDHDPGWAGTDELAALCKDTLKERARAVLDDTRTDLAEAQELLYADDRYAVLVVLQALDAAGKDGTIKHVLSGVNPQGCQVFSFKQPSREELDHTFLWRYGKCVPERGRIGIFNRSYYEDVLVTRVHPDRLGPRHADQRVGRKFWRRRYADINAFERHLVRNGTVVLKFFLHLSKDEQRKRLLARLDRPDKTWKFEPADLAERAYWGRYRRAYEAALSATSTRWAPWYVIPADHKWVTRAAVADLLYRAVRKLDLKFPEVPADRRPALAEARRRLLADD